MVSGNHEGQRRIHDGCRVLTLLILENGLGENHSGVFSSDTKRVLTLLILENGLGAQKNCFTWLSDLCVLTLLILENGLGEAKEWPLKPELVQS